MSKKDDTPLDGRPLITQPAGRRHDRRAIDLGVRPERQIRALFIEALNREYAAGPASVPVLVLTAPALVVRRRLPQSALRLFKHAIE
jgi:hypothetical protein